MTHHPTPRRIGRALTLLSLLCGILPAAARAGDFSGHPFGLRLSAALNRFSSYADVAGVGGASAASPWSSSVNPASTDWKKLESRFGVSLSPQFAAVTFKNGTDLYVAAESGTVNLGDYGTLQPALAQAFSNEDTARTGLDFKYTLYLGQIQWGKRINDQWAIGAAFSASSSDTDFDLGPASAVDGHSDSYNFRAGALYQPADRWMFGAVVEGGWTRNSSDTFINLGAGTGHDFSTSYQFATRVGLAYRYGDDPKANDSAFYLDYQFGDFWDHSDTLITNRFQGGIDHQIVKGLWARAGMSVDDRGKVSGTAGVGIYPNDWLSIDLGYQWDFFPELNPDFGQSQTFVLSISLLF